MYNRDMNKQDRARQIMTFLPAVYLAAKSSKTPVRTKILAALTVAYALSPIDLIPDFIPVIGYLDDLIILPAMITWTIHSMPKELFDSFMKEAENRQNDYPRKRWIYAVPILLFYILILYLILHAFLH